MAEIPSWGELLGGAEGRGGPSFPKTGSVYQGLKQKATEDPSFRKIFASDMARLAPEIRNPLLSSVNFFIPPERSVLNQWIRYYYRFHPLVSNIINLHAELPMSRFGLKDVKDPAHLSFYEEMVEEMDLFQLLLDILKEYHLLGEAFPFLYWEDEFNCFTTGELINPDFIDVRGHPLVRGGEKAYRFELIPDQTIRDFVSSNHPDDIELRQSLEPEILSAIASGKNIRLDPFNVSIIAKKQHRYEPRGTSMVLSVLKDLLYEDKLREAQYSIAEGHITPKQIWKIGDKDHMPLQEDLEDFRELLISANNDPIFSIVTHYGVQADFVGSAGKVLPLLPEFEFVYNRVLTGLFANKSLIHGEGVNYQNASVGLRVLMSRYIAIRGKLEDWARTKIFMPVAIANDFYHIRQADVDHKVRTQQGEGERELDLPQFDWRSKQNLLDDSLQKQLLMQLLQRTKIPMKVVADAMDMEYDYLKKWLKSEEGTVFDEVYQKRRDELSKQRMTERIKMTPTVETKTERSGPSDSIDVGTDVMGVTEEPAPAAPEEAGAAPEAGEAPAEAPAGEAAPAAPGGEAGAAAGKITPVMKSKDQTMLEKGEPHTEHKPMKVEEDPKEKTFGLGDITGTKQKTKMAERILAKYKGKPGIDAAKYVNAVLNIGSFAVTDLNEKKIAEIIAELTPESEKKKIEVGGPEK